MEPKKSTIANLENKKTVWIGVGLLAAFAIVLASLAWKSYEIEHKVSIHMGDDNMDDEEIIAVNLNTPPPPPPPPPPQQQTTILDIVEDDEEIEEEIEVDDMDVDEDSEIEEVEEVEEEEEAEDVVFMRVENMPAFPGCENEPRDKITDCTGLKVRTYIQQNVKYPQICLDANIQGKVWVYYEIGRDGKVKNAKIAKGVHSKLDAEALRVIKRLPPHTPGSQQGKKVTVKYTIPVNFKIG